ncbi:hypothetical protein [Ruegeria sp. HKCCSA071]|uniref:hypothetical protein n=1 Tax=Ruegeria sp. HKCCSA071 TaxID=2794834 RepID=UPI001AE4D14B|nr:hypothetical protein [Ruegeria sp. HKCCSA071]
MVALPGAVGAIDQLLSTRASIDIVAYLGISTTSFFLCLLVIYLSIELLFFPKIVAVVDDPDHDRSSQERFVLALVDYVEELKERGKVSTILSIRHGLSHFLHLVGEHSARTSLGEAAFQAAVELDDKLAKSSILVDELGWAVHAGGDSARAKKNIVSGVQEALSIGEENTSAFVKSRLVAAKGSRHLAVITSDEKNLEKAEEIISALTENSSAFSLYRDEILIDQAQLQHARSTLIARQFQIEKGGSISNPSASDLEATARALTLTRAAAETFGRLGDHERTIKALSLEQRICEAVGDDTGAMEARAKKDRVGRSLSLRYG